MLDDLVGQWLDEYGTSVHPIPALPFETRAVSSHVEAPYRLKDSSAHEARKMALASTTP
jgi:hypothetical protein